ncbi:hypothetical protein [Dyadobacter fermentans]|uniref:Uncharacterized protein n=1 Tax=Dyadobacter fermentans (strain ATCC 700827 / DSM 18053 / CIP 107007 / KCTC 52180 / NS114) TaxID=471854 RepID=C6VY93_DYAFD|nr:hypothetical protein [Dyadobacter fermentans]ACT91572.1 hypothetical protein Dfer_0302 [Dyadobacter fermentans DSM 18053]
MKKLVVSALALTLISFASVQAQTANQNTADQSADKQATTQKAAKEEKVAVKTEDLPEGIKKTIKSDEFSGWTVKKAFLVTEPDKAQYYELQVANGSQSARVKLDKDGKNVG